MTALQTVCLLAVAVAGTATVLTRDPLRQAVIRHIANLPRASRRRIQG